jgi:hypothetical protein
MFRDNTDFYGNPIKRDENDQIYSVLADGSKNYTNQPDPTMPNAQGRKMYEQKVAEMQPEQVVGESSGSGKSSSAGSAAMAAGSSLAQGGSGVDAASAGLMASGNPYAMAGGLALQTISAINKSKQQREQNRYLAEVQRVKARQDAIDKMASIGQNLRA